MMQSVRDTWAQLRAVSPQFLMLMLGLYAISLLTNGGRYRAVLAGLGVDLTLLRASAMNWSCIFVSNVTPGKVGGELFRVLLLRQQCGVDVALGGVAQGYDRLTDVLPMALLVVGALPTLRAVLRLSWPGGQIGLAAIAVVACLAGAVLLFRRADRLRARLRGWRDRLQRYQISRARWAAAQSLGFLLVVLDLLRLAVAGQAFGVDMAPSQVVALAAVMLVGGLSPTLGGLGVVEGGLTAALVLFGVPLPKALAVALFERAVSYGVGTAGGGIALLLLGGGQLWRSLRRRADGADAAAAAQGTGA